VDNPTQAIYDALAPTYDRRWRTYLDLSLQKVVHALSLRGDEHILDVACGTGELVRRLLERWPDLQITAADLSPGMLRQAHAKVGSPNVAWIQADAAALPLAPGGFDVAVCANSFHYFRRPQAVLQEIRRLLLPGGRFILVDWCDDFLLCKLCSFWLRWTDPAFFRTYTADECRTLLTAAGFEVIKVATFRAGWLWGMMLLICTVRREPSAAPT